MTFQEAEFFQALSRLALFDLGASSQGNIRVTFTGESDILHPLSSNSATTPKKPNPPPSRPHPGDLSTSSAWLQRRMLCNQPWRSRSQEKPMEFHETVESTVSTPSSSRIEAELTVPACQAGTARTPPSFNSTCRWDAQVQTPGDCLFCIPPRPRGLGGRERPGRSLRHDMGGQDTGRGHPTSTTALVAGVLQCDASKG